MKILFVYEKGDRIRIKETGAVATVAGFNPKICPPVWGENGRGYMHHEIEPVCPGDHDQLPGDPVKAEAQTNDGELTAPFDARAFLGQASDEEIRRLARGGWAGEEAAAAATFYADRNLRLAAVCAHRSRHKDLAGFACALNAQDALRWLRVHRSVLAAEIGKESREAPR